jgi:hypothetical protein
VRGVGRVDAVQGRLGYHEDPTADANSHYKATKHVFEGGLFQETLENENRVAVRAQHVANPVASRCGEFCLVGQESGEVSPLLGHDDC